MTKNFTLENLDCANCAAKLERKLSKITGVNEATVTFMTKKLTIDCDESIMDSVVEEANKIIHKLEPEVVIKER